MSQNFRSLPRKDLILKIFSQRMSQSVSELIKDQSVCRTALATLGLLREINPVLTSGNGSKSLFVLAHLYVSP